MNSYESFASPKGPAKWLLWSSIFIFLTTLTTFTILEVRSLNSEEPSVICIILNTLKYTNEAEPLPGEGQQVDRYILVNAEDTHQAQDEMVKAVVSKVETENSSALQRKAREADSGNMTEVHDNKNSYYEEQTPVVIYSKTDQETPLANRQETPIPYQEGSHEEQPYYNGDDANDDGRGGGNANSDYANDEENYYRPQYDDDSREDFEGPQSYNAEQDSTDGRSSQNRQHNAYYRQWHYATPAPSPLSASSSAAASKAAASSFSPSLYTALTASSKGNRKLPDMTAPATGGTSSDPYASYIDDYDYMSPHRTPAVPQQYQKHQGQAYRPQTSSQELQKQENEGSEMSFLNILKTLKTLFDLYQSFATAWNSMAEQRNKQEELAKQKYKQRQQLRINSKKPPKIISKTKPDGPARNTKNPKQTTTTLAPTGTPSLSTEVTTSSAAKDKEEKVAIKTKQLQKAKVEPRKGSKGDKTTRKDVEGLREKRDAENREDTSTATDIAEGRYIKGDPLKGYYDFVITEGSYKFWAVFQVGTALLIIYSTFAAIYYSKVNPLVSDYDYTDYLGGARSLSGGDLDFVDDETTTDGVSGSGSGSGQHKGAPLSRGWFDWMPRTGHSLQFILDAIDKLPVDHDATTGDAHDDVREHLNESTQTKAM